MSTRSKDMSQMLEEEVKSSADTVSAESSLSTTSDDMSQMLEEEGSPSADVVQVDSSLPDFDFQEADDTTELSEESQLKSPQWRRLVKGKAGGANEGGAAAGLYEVQYQEGHRQKIYLKQDKIEDKNIAEVFASHFMRFIAQEIGENPELIARVDYVGLSDRDSQQIYIGSYVVEGYRDLYLDAALAYHLPENERLRGAISDWKTLPAGRPRFIGSEDAYITQMLSSGRYVEGLQSGFAIRNLSEDPDVHYENAGATLPSPSNKKIPLIINGKYSGYHVIKKEEQGAEQTVDDFKVGGLIYQKIQDDKTNYFPDEFDRACIAIRSGHDDAYYIIPAGKVKLVHIDFGGALGDIRRKLDGKVHLDKFDNFFRYFLIGGPPAYHNNLPTTVTKDMEFFKTLARYSTIPVEKLEAKIRELVEQAKIQYSENPAVFKAFAQRIGAPLPENKEDMDELANSISQFMIVQFKARQNDAKKEFFKYFKELSHANQFDLLRAYAPQNLVGSYFAKEQVMEDFFHDLTGKEKELTDALVKIMQIDQREHGAYFPHLKERFHRRILRAYSINDEQAISKEVIIIDEVLVILNSIRANAFIDKGQKNSLQERVVRAYKDFNAEKWAMESAEIKLLLDNVNRVNTLDIFSNEIDKKNPSLQGQLLGGIWSAYEAGTLADEVQKIEPMFERMQRIQAVSATALEEVGLGEEHLPELQGHLQTYMAKCYLRKETYATLFQDMDNSLTDKNKLGVSKARLFLWIAQKMGELQLDFDKPFSPAVKEKFSAFLHKWRTTILENSATGEITEEAMNSAANFQILISKYNDKIKKLTINTNNPKLSEKLRAFQAELQLQLIKIFDETDPKVKKQKEEQLESLLTETEKLITSFNSKLSDKKDKTPSELDEIYKSYTKATSDYESQCIKLSLPQKLLIAACAFAGALLGTVIGAILGLIIGTAIGGGTGSVAPVVGNIAGAIAGGSMVGVLAAIKGAGIGAMVGTAAGLFLLGGGFSLAAGKGMRLGLFSKTDKAVKELAQELKKELHSGEAREKSLADAPEPELDSDPDLPPRQPRRGTLGSAFSHENPDIQPSNTDIRDTVLHGGTVPPAATIEESSTDDEQESPSLR